MLPHWPANAVCGVLTLTVVSPLLRAVVMRKNHTASARTLWRRRVNRPAVAALFAVRYALAVGVVYYVLNYLSPLSWIVHIVVAAVLVGLLCASRLVKYWSIRMERTFKHNLGVRERAAESQHPAYARRLRAHDMHASQVEIPAHSQWGGKALKELALGGDGVMIAAVKRGDMVINIPVADTVVYPRDVLTVIADDDGLAAFTYRLGTEVNAMPEDSGQPIVMRRIAIATHPALAGVKLRDSGLRDRYQCMAVGFEAKDGSLDTPTADYEIRPTDVLYVVGESHHVARLEKETRKKM